MNNGNLKRGNPATQFSSGRVAVENGSKGGLAAKKSRERNKAMKQVAQMLLAMPNTNAVKKQQMDEMGILTEDQTNQVAMLVEMLLEAEEGSVPAAIFMRDTAGYSSRSEEFKAEMKHRKAELDYKKQKDARGNTGISASTEDDPITKALKGEFNIAD